MLVEPREYRQLASIEDAMKIVLGHLVDDPTDPEYARTPERAASWFKTFCRVPHYETDNDKFLDIDFESPHAELIMVSNIHWVSICPHHLLPYSGEAAVGYIPGYKTPGKRLPEIKRYRVVGISKLARAVKYWTQYAVKQEDATADIADGLMKFVGASGAMVILTAKHMCMAERGVMQPGSVTTTSALRGHFLEDGGGLRQEFLSLMRAAQ